MAHYKLALLGFGNVGQALVNLLLEKQEELKATYDLTFSITGIATGSHRRFLLSRTSPEVTCPDRSPRPDTSVALFGESIWLVTSSHSRYILSTRWRTVTMSFTWQHTLRSTPRNRGSAVYASARTRAYWSLAGYLLLSVGLLLWAVHGWSRQSRSAFLVAPLVLFATGSTSRCRRGPP